MGKVVLQVQEIILLLLLPILRLLQIRLRNLLFLSLFLCLLLLLLRQSLRQILLLFCSLDCRGVRLFASL